MICVPSGSRVVFTAGGASQDLLVLAAGEVRDGYALPVLPAPDAVEAAEGTALLPTEAGLVRTAARLHSGDGRLELIGPEPVRPVQRRADVRGEIEIRLHGTVSAGPRGNGARGPVPRVAFRGRTRDISTGGLRAVVEATGRGPRLPGHPDEMYVELDLGGPRPAGAVLRVVSLRSDQLRARFVFLAPADREQLAQRLLAQA